MAELREANISEVPIFDSVRSFRYLPRLRQEGPVTPRIEARVLNDVVATRQRPESTTDAASCREAREQARNTARARDPLPRRCDRRDPGSWSEVAANWRLPQAS